MSSVTPWWMKLSGNDRLLSRGGVECFVYRIQADGYWLQSTNYDLPLFYKLQEIPVWFSPIEFELPQDQGRNVILGVIVGGLYKRLLDGTPVRVEGVFIDEKDITVSFYFADDYSKRLELQQFKKDYKLIEDSKARAQV